MQTKENLSEAFAYASQANRKCLCYAAQAEAESNFSVGKLFRAVAEAEANIAINGFMKKGSLRSTSENLQAALIRARNGSVELYEPMIKKAEEEGDAEAAKLFRLALEAEQVHARLYEAAIETLKKPAEASDYYVCPECGNVLRGPLDSSEACSLCGTKSFYKVFDQKETRFKKF